MIELKSIFTGWPASLRNAADEAEYKRTFVKSLVQFGVSSDQQIRRGLRKAREMARDGERFMPSGAAFAGWCFASPEELGVDPYEVAFKKLIAREWESIHPAFYRIARSTHSKRVTRNETDGETWEQKSVNTEVLRYDIERMKQLPRGQADELFKPLYREVCRRVEAGEKFEPFKPEHTLSHNPTGVIVSSRKAGQKKIKDLIAFSKSTEASHEYAGNA